MAINPRRDDIDIIFEPYCDGNDAWCQFLDNKLAVRLIYEMVGPGWTVKHLSVLDEIRELYWTTDISTMEIRDAYMPQHSHVLVSQLAGPVKLNKGCRKCGADIFVTSHHALNNYPSSGRDCPKCWQAWYDQLQDEYNNQPPPPDYQNMPYREYLQTEHWQYERKAALKRSGFACQMCSAKGELHVHHRTYARRGCEWNSDLIVLCAKCHQIFHDNGKLADGGRAL